MARWKKPDDEVKPGTLQMRAWLDTEAGQKHRKRHAEYAKEWRKNNPEKAKASRQRANAKRRYEVLAHYSGGEPKCACCGETELVFLQLDHINDDGAEHRRQIGMAQGNPYQVGKQKQKVQYGGNSLPCWLIKNGFPEGFQVLCANCNWGKRHEKGCPHTWKKEG